MKKCSKCQKDQKIQDFHQNHACKDGRETICKNCKSEANKKRNTGKNYDFITCSKTCPKCGLEKSSNEFSRDKYSKDGKTANCKNCRNKHKKNKRLETNGAYDRDYRLKKYKNNINYRTMCNIRSRINKAIKNKQYKTIEYLGCSIEEYIKYLESLFVEGMSWENRHLWHIDHIRPCCSFDLIKESERLLCFNYKNTQPMWAKDNFDKSSKY